MLVTALAAAGCEGGILDPIRGDAAADGGDEDCSPRCADGWICQDGRCFSPGDPCVGVDCPSGSTCNAGTCVAGNPCLGVICQNIGEVCQDGDCVAGSDDGDGDGFAAANDCDDTSPTVHPGSAEACNGTDDDCDTTTEDGASECPGLCCGAPLPTCQECCAGTDCGLGEWSCTANVCACEGRECDGACYRGATCCAPADCGDGEWECTDAHQCSCPATISR